MNTDAEKVISEKADQEYIRQLIEAMKKMGEQLEYLIEILE